jgi:decaprenylphospho-beta-D-ribofuranose 2-oxidase
MPPEHPTTRLLTGWGRTAPTAATVHRPHTVDDVRVLLAGASGRGVIARGLGRSYGDAAQVAGGDVLDITALAGSRDIDPETGIVTASAGLSLETLMRDLLALGWFVPVTPGTRHVTVGGAIAADIHGKNHHVDGSFGAHLRSITLVTPDGSVRTLAPDGGDTDDTALFWATVGGMGLTGVIVEATFQATPVETSLMRVDTERANNLDAALETMAATDDSYRYTVAWIDLLATGDSMGRSVLTRGHHATLADLPERKRSRARRFDPAVRLQAPPWAPPRLLNRLTVRAFNEVWFRKAPVERRGAIQPITAFFHPLDFVGGWNRLYGSAGMVQYQFVVPFGAEDTLRRIVERLSSSGIASFLAVLKRFGPANPGLLSFPQPGWTLALDIPAGVPGLAGLLAELDVAVADAGGRVYLAKDAVLSRDLLPKMYPRLAEWQSVRARVDPDATMCSDLSRRLGL